MRSFDMNNPRIYEPRVFLYRPGSRAISPQEELQQTAELFRNNL